MITPAQRHAALALRVNLTEVQRWTRRNQAARAAYFYEQAHARGLPVRDCLCPRCVNRRSNDAARMLRRRASA